MVILKPCKFKINHFSILYLKVKFWLIMYNILEMNCRWQTTCVLAEGLLHLICLVGLIAAICIVIVWVFAGVVIYNWMRTQSGHGIAWQNKQIEGDYYCQGLPPGSRIKPSSNVVNKSGVMWHYRDVLVQYLNFYITYNTYKFAERSNNV